MDDVFEQVVAENRELRRQVETLHERVRAFESSRWWRLHPRRLVTRAQKDDGAAEVASPAKVRRLAQSRRLRAEHERRSAGREPDEVVVRDGIRLKVHPAARWSVEQFCYAAPPQVEELDVFIANTSDRRRLLDVGALHGIFSLVFTAGDPTKQALAVDASPVPFATLLYNIHRNGAGNVTAVECALSDEPGTLEMHHEAEHAVAGAGANGDVSLRVETETGDRLCSRHAFEPDVVKIDVEGHELRVLQGLRATLRRARPLLFLEIHPRMISADRRNGTLSELADELRELGYPRAELHGSVVPVDELRNLDEIERILLRPE